MIQQFDFRPTRIEGVYEILAFAADDERGCLTKDYSKEAFEAHGIEHVVAESTCSTSYKGAIRGLHFQRVRQQAKLVRCISGRVWDVAVDLRKDSPTFREWVAFDLIGGGA